MSMETLRMVARSCVPMQRWWVAAVLAAVGLSACSSTESNGELTCGRQLSVCDIGEVSCRSAILDSVACLRGYTMSVSQPEVTFIMVKDLEGSVSEEDDREVTVRRAYSLFDLVAASEIDADAALSVRVNSIAAIYSDASKRVYIVENPGGEELDERELGMPVDVYRMTVLAHEYVHFLQDLEFDLEGYSAHLPTAFDPWLARVSAVEGEADLFEGLFTLDLAGREVDEPGILKRLKESLDAADEAVRNADSPYLMARYAFPYTYGTHSSAVLYFDRGHGGLERLRRADSTLEYLQRRTGVPPEKPSATLPEPNQFSGLESVVEDQLGAWLFGLFVSRVGGVSTSEGRAEAMNWQTDRLQVWRTSDDEIVAQWVVKLDPVDAGDGETNVQRLKAALRAGKPEATPTWIVRSSERQLSITASTLEGSERALEVADAWGPDQVAEEREPTNADDERAPMELNSKRLSHRDSDLESNRDPNRETWPPSERHSSPIFAAATAIEAHDATTPLTSQPLPSLLFSSLSNPELRKQRQRLQERLRRYVRQNVREAQRSHER
jgi:hypothetical protein